MRFAASTLRREIFSGAAADWEPGLDDSGNGAAPTERVETAATAAGPATGAVLLVFAGAGVDEGVELDGKGKVAGAARVMPGAAACCGSEGPARNHWMPAPNASPATRAAAANTAGL